MAEIEPITIEKILTQYSWFVIVLLLIVVTRILLTRIVTILFERGIFSIGTKAMLTRIIDTIMIIVVIIAVLQLFQASMVGYLVMVIVAAMILIVFFYEIREFTAYVSLQLLRYIKGRSLEIHLPGHQQPVYGKIIAMDPMSSIIEDIYGNKYFVANSILVNALVKEKHPSILIRLVLTRRNNITLKELIENIVGIFGSSDLPTFRLRENQIEIVRVEGNKVVLNIYVTPIAIPVRVVDIVKLVETLNYRLRDYEPVIEVIR